MDAASIVLGITQTLVAFATVALALKAGRSAERATLAAERSAKAGAEAAALLAEIRVQDKHERAFTRLERVLRGVVEVQETAVSLRHPADVRSMPIGDHALMAPAVNGLKAALASVPEDLPLCRGLADEFDVERAIGMFVPAFEEARQAVLAAAAPRPPE